ncbi:MAG: AAA family ATPase [Deltaproteobacteria bacterium]|nr:AAA family ATPase [Deltaproteobacteria bacterium]
MKRFVETIISVQLRLSLSTSLLNTKKSYYMSKTRRFGKSLLVSTIEAVLQWHRELFKGL